MREMTKPAVNQDKRPWLKETSFQDPEGSVKLASLLISPANYWFPMFFELKHPHPIVPYRSQPVEKGRPTTEVYNFYFRTSAGETHARGSNRGRTVLDLICASSRRFSGTYYKKGGWQAVAHSQ